jgi:uncharacterized protein
MLKLVIVVVAVLVLAWLLFGRRGVVGRGSGRSAPREVEGMVACAHCGVHLPASEAVRQGALHYCGTAHRDAGPRAGPP